MTEVCGFILGLKETPPVEDIISVTIWRHAISLPLLKNISGVSTVNKWNTVHKILHFNTREEILYPLDNTANVMFDNANEIIANHFISIFFGGTVYYVTIATMILSSKLIV